jgi:hypothetical protein
LNSKTNSLKPRQDGYGSGCCGLIYPAQGSGSAPCVRDPRPRAGAIAATRW